MASTAPALYNVNEIIGQPVTWDLKSCDDFCMVIATDPSCDNNAIKDPNFLADPMPIVAATYPTGNWGLDQASAFAVQVSAGVFTPGSCVPTGMGTNRCRTAINQAITLAAGTYRAFFSFGTSATSDFNVSMNLTGSGNPILFQHTGTIFSGSYDFTVTGAAARNLQLYFEAVAVSTDTIFNYFYICEITAFSPRTTFCLQLPLFRKAGDELLAITNEEVGFGTIFQYTIDTADSTDTRPSGTACGAPFNSFSQTLDAGALGLQLTNAGQYFWAIEMLDIAISFGINYSDNTVDQLVISMRDGTLAREDEIAITENDSNTNVFFLGSTDWVALDNPSLWIKARSECDDSSGDEEIVWNLEVGDYAATPNFFEKTFTGASDTFYRLSYTLNKTSASNVEVIDSASATIFAASSDGVRFDKIFKTGTLPTTTVTVRFEVQDMLEYPNTNWQSAVLTDVQLWEMCTWEVSMEPYGGPIPVSPDLFTETHDTTNETTDVSYHDNIEYCFDMLTLSAGCYQVRAIDQCDITNSFASACLVVCEDNCDVKQISWTLNRVICSGDEVLDYVAYPATPHFWIQASLQDLTVEEENAVYRRSDGYHEKPWAYLKSLQVLQVWPMPPHLRQTLATAMTGTFMIDGVEYQKIDDDDFTPQFNAVHDAPMRIIVGKVGDFIISRE